MTLRQLFYRLVSAGHLPSTDKKYYRQIGRVMNRLRRSGDVPMPWMVDNTRATMKPSSWSGVEDFAEHARRLYRRDFWAQQPVCVEILLEKDATAGSLWPITRKYDVSLHVNRGYSSLSFAYSVAELWCRVRKPIHAYYLGDYDPSGRDLERFIRKEIAHHARRPFTWQRLGVLESDFEAFNLLPLEVKRTDSRAKRFLAECGDRCAELDALPPTELRRRVETAILSHVDQAAWERVQLVENAEREALATVLNRIGKGLENGPGTTFS